MLEVLEVQTRTDKTGNEFFVLIVGTEPTIVQSNSGNFRVTSRKVSIPTDINSREFLEKMVGNKIPGTIIKKQLDKEYTFIGRDGSEITIDYTYEYSPKE